MISDMTWTAISGLLVGIILGGQMLTVTGCSTLGPYNRKRDAIYRVYNPAARAQWNYECVRHKVCDRPPDAPH